MTDNEEFEDLQERYSELRDSLWGMRGALESLEYQLERDSGMGWDVYERKVDEIEVLKQEIQEAEDELESVEARLSDLDNDFFDVDDSEDESDWW